VLRVLRVRPGACPEVVGRSPPRLSVRGGGPGEQLGYELLRRV
jgi:hypothetical protein